MDESAWAKAHPTYCRADCRRHEPPCAAKCRISEGRSTVRKKYAAARSRVGHGRIGVYGILAGAALFFLVASLNFVYTQQRSCWERMRATEHRLNHTRDWIQDFRRETGSLPVSLEQLERWERTLPGAFGHEFPPIEQISGHANSSEHITLDGRGGFFYDPNTGDIRVNLTKPVRHYWPWYFGERRDEIPADW
jgi:hypothetical protein